MQGVAEQQGGLLGGRAGRERQVRQRAIVGHERGAFRAPLDIEPGGARDRVLDARALAEEVRPRAVVELVEQEHGVLDEAPRELVRDGAPRTLDRRGVALAGRVDRRRRVGGERLRGVAQQGSEPPPVDREKRLVLAGVQAAVARLRAGRVLDDAPGDEQLEPVGEREPLGARLEVDRDRRVAVGRGRRRVAGELGERRLRPSALERREGAEEQHDAAVGEARPFVARPPAAGFARRRDAQRSPGGAIGRRADEPGRGGADVQPVAEDVGRHARELRLVAADQRERLLAGPDERRREQRPEGGLALLLGVELADVHRSRSSRR